MLVEKSIKEALMDYAKGRKVVVLQFDAKGRIDANLLSDFFEDENNKYLVDVPAYNNPDFEAAVQEMTCEILSADQIVAAVHETQEDSAEEESIAPPHDAGTGRRNDSPGGNKRSGCAADEETGKDH